MNANYNFLIIALVLVSGCLSNNSNEELQPPENSILVEITPSGFVPNTLTINAGDTVTWVNKDSASHWPASANHPTHDIYPEPGGCIGSKFDSCKGLGEGEFFSFTFNHKGEWKYHDHLNAAAPFFGTIIVQ